MSNSMSFGSFCFCRLLLSRLGPLPDLPAATRPSAHIRTPSLRASRGPDTGHQLLSLSLYLLSCSQVFPILSSASTGDHTASIQNRRSLCNTYSGVLDDQVFEERIARLLHCLLPSVVVHAVTPMHRLLPSGHLPEFTTNISQHQHQPASPVLHDLEQRTKSTSVHGYTSLTEFVIFSIITLSSMFVAVAAIASNYS